MQSRKSQLAEYVSLTAEEGDEGKPSMVCDRCLQEIDAHTFESNVARLEQLAETAFEAQSVEGGRAVGLEVYSLL